MTPVVPIIAACSPAWAQIWRRNDATEVLPAVPVTAPITRGCGPKKAAAMRASASRGSAARITGRLIPGSGASLAATIATAPLDAASAANRPPSVFTPARAKNRLPGSTVRLSAVSPVKVRSGTAMSDATASVWGGRASISADSFMKCSVFHWERLRRVNSGWRCPARHLFDQYGLAFNR